MALSTYSELKVSAAAWLNRTDLTSIVGDFVTLAESDIRNDVRVQAMETRATGTLTGETLAHPTRYIEARTLFVGGKQYKYRTPEKYQILSDAGSTERVFTSIGQSLYILGGTSGDAYVLVYWQSFAPFSADADTNWVLTNAPDVYLWATCKQGAVWLKDQMQEARFGSLYASAVSRLNGREKFSAVSGSPLEIQSAISE